MSLVVNSALIGCSALAAAAVSVPAFRRSVLGNINRDWLLGELDFDELEDDSFYLKDGTVCSVYRFGGLSFDTLSRAKVLELQKLRSQLLHELAGLGVTLRFYGSKRRRDLDIRSDYDWIVLRDIGRREAESFHSAYRTEWHLLLNAAHRLPLAKAHELLTSSLAEYEPRRLTSSADSCALSAFADYCLTGNLRAVVPKHSRLISGNVASSNLRFERHSGIIQTEAPLSCFSRVIAIRSWPESVSGTLFEQLFAVPAELDVMTSFRPRDRKKAEYLLQRKKKELQTSLITRHDAELGELESLMIEIGEGKTSIGQTETVLYCRARTRDALDSAVTTVCEVLARFRIQYNVETGASAALWFTRSPGRNQVIRPLNLTSYNVATLWPFARSSTGQADSPWGKGALRYFRTVAGEAYRFQFHVNPAPQAKGHFLVFAPTGSGKSTLVMHLISGVMKYPRTRAYVLDSHAGARYMIECFGGQYLSADSLELNPLDIGEDTPAARQRIYFVLRAILGGNYDDRFSDEINHALDITFTIDRKERRLSNIFEHAFARNQELYRLLEPWVTTSKGKVGFYSHVFGAERDSLANVLSASRILGIDLSELLKDPALGAPVVTHLAESVRAGAEQDDGNGFLIFIDEAANLLRNPEFAKLTQVMFREYRKLDGVVGLAFQDPTALTMSPVADALIENVATLIFFPNPTSRPEAYERFNLNEEQLDFICGDTPRRRQVLVIRRDSATGLNESVIINVDLSFLGEAVKYYRAGSEPLRRLRHAQASQPDNWWELL